MIKLLHILRKWGGERAKEEREGQRQTDRQTHSHRVIYLEMRPHEISLIHFGMSTSNVIVKYLIRGDFGFPTCVIIVKLFIK